MDRWTELRGVILTLLDGNELLWIGTDAARDGEGVDLYLG